MSICVRWQCCLLLMVLGLHSPRASAQAAAPAEQPTASVAQRAQRMSTYLADALRLNARQATKLRVALEKRFDSAEMLGHLLFSSSQAAATAYENIDFRYYAAVGKLLTPTQFHLFLELDEPSVPADAPMMVQKR